MSVSLDLIIEIINKALFFTEKVKNKGFAGCMLKRDRWYPHRLETSDSLAFFQVTFFFPKYLSFGQHFLLLTLGLQLEPEPFKKHLD